MNDRDEIMHAHILIVDDRPANVMFLEKLLARQGYLDVRSTTDPREVAALVQAREPDLILLDLMMPHLDGFAVIAELKRLLPAEHYLPILVLTADVNQASRRRALDEGAMDFLTKPLDATEVLQRTHNLLYTRLLHKKQRRHSELLEQKVEERTADLIKANWALRSANLEILARLARAAEYRDDNTGQHTFRVGHPAHRTVLELSLPTPFAELLLHAARLHDVGKIGIPDSILLKPGRFTDDEVAVMRDHCVIGATLLSGSRSDLLSLAESVALTHHERFDGDGYPNGLAGDAIPIEGRIVAVVDVFDALTHARPYKEAWSFAEAVALLRDERGKSFDPAVVDAFLRVLSRENSATDEELHPTATVQMLQP